MYMRDDDTQHSHTQLIAIGLYSNLSISHTCWGHCVVIINIAASILSLSLTAFALDDSAVSRSNIFFVHLEFISTTFFFFEFHARCVWSLRPKICSKSVWMCVCIPNGVGIVIVF